MNLPPAVRGARNGQKRVLRLQRHLWLAELALWPTAILLSMLLATGAWVLWQRKARERGAATATAAPVPAPETAAGG